MTTLTRRYRFEASHQIHEYDGKCSRLHGHNYVLEYTVTGDLDKHGMILDAGVLDDLWADIYAEVDHAHLNNVLPGPPSTERLCRYLHQRMMKGVNRHGAALVKTRLQETPRLWAEVRS